MSIPSTLSDEHALMWVQKAAKIYEGDLFWAIVQNRSPEVIAAIEARFCPEQIATYKRTYHGTSDLDHCKLDDVLRLEAHGFSFADPGYCEELIRRRNIDVEVVKHLARHMTQEQINDAVKWARAALVPFFLEKATTFD